MIHLPANQESFGGLDSYMTTSQFADLVHKHAYRPNIRFHVSRWGQINNAPAETCTLTVGNVNDGHAYNIPMPNIPARSQIDEKTGRIVHRGWRALLIWMLSQRICRPNLEFEMYMGSRDYQAVMMELGAKDRKSFKFDLKGIDSLAASVS